jgi:hypothetical protein
MKAFPAALFGFLLVTPMLAVGIPQPPDQPYELKGEAPGMTLKQFKSNHKHADCTRHSAMTADCRVYEGVSFAGVIAENFKGCDVPQCVGQGIVAKFVNDRLISLTYSVRTGSFQEIIAALKAKFGEPVRLTGSSALSSAPNNLLLALLTSTNQTNVKVN